MYELRDYQERALQDALSFLKTYKKPGILVAPTAAGKSLLIANIVKEYGKNAIVLQPSVELLKQNHDKYNSYGFEASIYSASANSKQIGEVTFATIGSVKDISHQFSHVELLILDECHISSRSGSLLTKFTKLLGKKVKILGTTATPFRLENYSAGFGSWEKFSKLKMLTQRGKGGNFFKDIFHITQIQELTEKGFWSPLIYELYDVKSGDLIFNSTKAEYTQESLEKFYKNQEIDKKILNRIEQSDRKHILVFVPSIDAADNLAKNCPNSASISSLTPKKERDQIINNFKAGTIRTIFNCQILQVGFDYPEIDMIILGRPTASLSLFYQILGRGTRIHPEKENCLIVDFTNNTNTFGKVEDLVYTNDLGDWNVRGSGGRLLTGVPINEIRPILEKSNIKMPLGKHEGKLISEIPTDYLSWMLKDFKWTNQLDYVRLEIIRIKEERIKTLI